MFAFASNKISIRKIRLFRLKEYFYYRKFQKFENPFMKFQKNISLNDPKQLLEI